MSRNRFGLSHSLLEAAKSVMEKKINDEEEKKLDPFDKKTVKKDFKDLKDKDIDNDGDSDDSDEYLHKKRQAISKNIEKTESSKDKKKYDESKDGNKKDLDNSNDVENINKDPKPVKVNYEPEAGDDDKLDEAVWEGKNEYS